MLFKPDAKESSGAGTGRSGWGARLRRRSVSLLLVTLILGGLGVVAWRATQTKQAERRMPPDLAVPVLAATPKVADVPVYLDGVGSVKPLATVTVRAQVDGKLIAVNFTEGQDVKAGDVLAEIDPAIYQAAYDQAVAKKAQDEAQLANARIDLARYQQLAASNAGSKQQADTQKATVAQLEAQVRSDQAAIDNAAATLSYTKVVAPISGRAGLRQVDKGNLVKSADTTGIVVITQLQPIAVQFSLPQQQIVRVNAAAAEAPLPVDVFGNDGVTVIDTGVLKGIDNQVDQTTGTVKLKAEFPNARMQLWPGQFVNVRLKVDTLKQAIVVPVSAVQRGPAGTFSYIIGDDNIVHARPVKVTQQNESEAVVAEGLTPADRVVTTGFANLAEGAKVTIGDASQTPAADLAPQKRRRPPGAQSGGGDAGEGQGKRRRGEAGQQQAPAQGAAPSSGAPKTP
ncbi:efflux RND transporter periplasmic adaptor subunit [Rhodopseudomonas palustris]|jgi:multidrug efflux system membrane fusion protein|uniref:Efflux transporter, RND family, MFP subunit n=1 Tax=Rhodopseudomonas palustris (strain DX-1) TaxID=652103 RepID=E6VKB1_RHOPX|nr:efflux RND transporter periplasmic adaptor subunit [Rhodopseudomonas palustris]QDL97320.1 efflux RND transporter periplasmic adaptor subunit [Rhodopseudomonas palustris]